MAQGQTCRGIRLRHFQRRKPRKAHFWTLFGPGRNLPPPLGAGACLPRTALDCFPGQSVLRTTVSCLLYELSAEVRSSPGPPTPPLMLLRADQALLAVLPPGHLHQPQCNVVPQSSNCSIDAGLVPLPPPPLWLIHTMWAKSGSRPAVCIPLPIDERLVAPTFSLPSPGGPAELRFDRILCDVMCSGDGTIRKHPSIWPAAHFSGLPYSGRSEPRVEASKRKPAGQSASHMPCSTSSSHFNCSGQSRKARL